MENKQIKTGIAGESMEKVVNDTACKISVVIAWVNSFDLLTAGLDALLSNKTRKADEIIVVTRHGIRAQMRFGQEYPDVHLLTALPGTPITKLRSIGIKQSTGNVVVVTEDHCVPSENWLSAVERRMNDGYQLVGGAVENGWDIRLRDTAAFLTEYSFAIKSKVDKDDHDQVQLIPGNNAAYSRAIVDDVCRTLEEDRWESFYYADLERSGTRAVYDSEMLLYHRRPFDFFYFISQRFHFCRSFAEMRSKSLSGAGRLRYGLGCAVLPPLLWLRGLRTLIVKQRMIGTYFLCSPLIAFYLCAGAVGEMYGYFFGGGDSLAKVE